jgi:hypothetical protein
MRDLLNLESGALYLLDDIGTIVETLVEEIVKTYFPL